MIHMIIDDNKYINLCTFETCGDDPVIALHSRNPFQILEFLTCTWRSFLDISPLLSTMLFRADISASSIY